ncbi:MAG: PepSY domain-containing protein [Defluviitaleaceae bacterium]|nr:PepSY domain-containing protein [Defluviitaleaceae bacterium]
MKKKLIASLTVTVVLAIGLFAVVWFGQDSIQAQQNLSASAATVAQAPIVQAQASSEAQEQMQEEIAELRALIQVLLGMIAEDLTDQSSQNTAAQVGIPQMSGQAAMNTAVEQLGFGTAEGVELLEIDGILTFVVDVTNGTLRYVVHVNAMTGIVMNFNIDDAVAETATQQPAAQVVPPPTVTQTPQPTNTPAPRATSSPSSSSPRR